MIAHGVEALGFADARDGLGIAVAHRVDMQLHGPAALCVLFTKPQHELSLIALGLLGAQSSSRQSLFESGISLLNSKGQIRHSLKAVVARDTVGLCKFFHPDFKSLEQRSKVRDGHTGDRGKVLDIRLQPDFSTARALSGAVGRNDLRAQKALFGYTVMVLKRIGGVLRRAEGIDIRALDKILRGVLAVGKDGLGIFPYLRSGLCV